MEQYASALTDLKLENSSLTISEKFWIWYSTPLPRSEDCFIVHIQPEGIFHPHSSDHAEQEFLGEKDIWDLMKCDPEKHRTYDLDHMVDVLLNHFNVEIDEKGRASGDPAKIAVCEKYFQKLMDLNFGSCEFDW